MGDEQQMGDPDIELLFLPYHLVWAEDSAEGAWYRHANGRQEHHRAIRPGRRWIESLIMKTKTAHQKCRTKPQKQVGEYGPNQRCPNHSQQTPLKRHHTDEQFRV